MGWWKDLDIDIQCGVFGVVDQADWIDCLPAPIDYQVIA